VSNEKEKKPLGMMNFYFKSLKVSFGAETLFLQVKIQQGIKICHLQKGKVLKMIIPL
jgi:hypothetical protein